MSNARMTTAIYALSLHDALPICLALTPRCDGDQRRQLLAAELAAPGHPPPRLVRILHQRRSRAVAALDRKSTRLNSSHMSISYAVFCLKKKTHSKIHRANELFIP